MLLKDFQPILSKGFRDLLIQNSFKHEFTSPYSPRQNGTRERNWSTLFDPSRSMLLESNLPKYLWAYAVMSTTSVRNCCYCQRIDNALNGLIPKMKPNIAKLHVFGSVCYSYVQNSKKLDAHSRTGYCVGYDNGNPPYLVYYPNNNSVMKHKVVKFTNISVMSRTPIKESRLFTDSKLGTLSVKSEDENTPENIEIYTSLVTLLRKTNSPPYLADYVMKSESEDLVNRVDFCYA